MSRQFNKDEHIFKSPELANLLKDSIRFFNGTPVYELPPPERFDGSGVYALYYTGESNYYNTIAETNRLAYDLPIYVGKAISPGGRRGVATNDKPSSSLYGRLYEHAGNIHQVKNLNKKDFHCRFMIIPYDEEGLISPIEAALIKLYNPLWNSKVDGFGNHTPGAGRFNQAKSSWDVIHPGRAWADKCTGKHVAKSTILAEIKKYNSTLEKR